MEVLLNSHHIHISQPATSPPVTPRGSLMGLIEKATMANSAEHATEILFLVINAPSLPTATSAQQAEQSYMDLCFDQGQNCQQLH